LEKGFLREVIGERRVVSAQMSEKVSHGGLMAVDQLSERGVIVRDEHAGDQFGVGHG
jgi:hypothetical protein